MRVAVLAELQSLRSMPFAALPCLGLPALMIIELQQIAVTG
jgi:hypothetical protein